MGSCGSWVPARRGSSSRRSIVQLRRRVAIKVLQPELAVSLRSRARFEREARAAGAVSHPHVVTIHGAGRTDGFPLPYLVMEYVAGTSLSDVLRRNERLSPSDAARLIAQVAAGLAVAHEQGLVHRDVKPSNILIERATGQAKLADFGIARAILAADDAESACRTSTGRIVGTPPYMSPEQARGGPIDARTDVYGLGATLYELLTGSCALRRRRYGRGPAAGLREPIPCHPAGSRPSCRATWRRSA